VVLQLLKQRQRKQGADLFRALPEVAMARTERVREYITGTLSPESLERRAEAGWRLVAVEWQRTVAGEGPEVVSTAEEIPYGLRIASDCYHLEPDPAESNVLMSMMELMVQDCSISHVASELNARGFRTRKGSPWSPVSVFNMLPRLIEAGPRMFSTTEWEARRKLLTRAG
jgi:hypothetical protein